MPNYFIHDTFRLFMMRSRKCTVAVFEGAGVALRLKEVDIPQPEPGEWLVKNLYTTLCASDMHTYTGKRQEKTPTILGHEITGVLVAAGIDAPTSDLNGRPLQAGARITWAIYASEPGSPNALRGIPQKGDGLFKYGHELLSDRSTLHGGLAEYTLLRKNTPIIALEEDVPLPVAALINCAVATMCGAFRLAGDVKDRNLLITGAGMLGVIGCAFAREHGAATIAVADSVAARLDTALSFGATVAAPLEAHSGPFDVVFDLTGNISVMEQSLQLMSIGGTAIWVGAAMPGPPVQVPAEKMVRNLWTIKGLHNYNATDLQMAAAFISKAYQLYPFETLVHGGFTLGQCNEAFEYARLHHPYRVGIKTELE